MAKFAVALKKASDGIGFLFSNKINVFVHALLARLFDGDSRFSSLATSNLLSLLKTFQPNIVILNNLHGYYINLNKLIDYINKNNIKVYFVLHDCWPFTGHCAQFEYVGCEKYKFCCSSCPNKNAYPKSVFADNSKENYLFKKRLFQSIKDLTIICPSHWMKQKVLSSFLKDKNTVVINNGIDTSVFKRGDSDFRKNNNLCHFRLILCIASIWNKQKGINDIVKLSEELCDDERIVLVGRLKNKIYLNNKIIHFESTDSIEEL